MERETGEEEQSFFFLPFFFKKKKCDNMGSVGHGCRARQRSHGLSSFKGSSWLCCVTCWQPSPALCVPPCKKSPLFCPAEGRKPRRLGARLLPRQHCHIGGKSGAPGRSPGLRVLDHCHHERAQKFFFPTPGTKINRRGLGGWAREVFQWE